MARYERLYWRASAKGDLGQCRQIEEAIVRLLGLAAPQRSEIAGVGGEPVKIIVEYVDAPVPGDETGDKR